MSEQRPWVKWVNSGSAVRDAVLSGKAFEQAHAGRVTLRKLSQGAELEADKPAGRLGELLQYESSPSPVYNSENAGPEQARAAAEVWAKHFLGIEGRAFILPVHGRQGLRELFNIGAQPYTDLGLNPQLACAGFRWSMVDINAKVAGIGGIVEYDGQVRPLQDAVRDALRPSFMKKYFADQVQGLKEIGGGFWKFLSDRHIDLRQKMLAVFSTNSPNNPMGSLHTTEENLAVKGELMETNRQRRITGAPEVMWVADNPYLFDAPQRSKEEQEAGMPVLKSGYEGVFKFDDGLKWGMVISGSKLWGTADEGFCVIVTSKSAGEELDKTLLAGLGLSYSKKAYAKMTEFFSPELYDEHAAHMQKLQGKHFLNNESAETFLQNRLVPTGDPGDETSSSMVRTIDVSGLLGKRVKLSDKFNAESFDVKTVDDALEYLMNEFNVVAVKGHDTEAYLRIALGDRPVSAYQSLESLANGLNMLERAPSLDMGLEA